MYTSMRDYVRNEFPLTFKYLDTRLERHDQISLAKVLVEGLIERQIKPTDTVHGVLTEAEKILKFIGGIANG